MRTNVEVAQEMVEAINAQNIAKVEMLLDPVTMLVDAHGVEVAGLLATLRAWQEYFQIFPKYTLEIKELIQQGSTVMIITEASGRDDGASRSIPCCIKAKVEAEKITLWQIFGDTWKELPHESANEQEHKKVTGIGGVFFKCADPESLKKWYEEHLGFVVDKYGTSFEWLQTNQPGCKGFTAWSPMSEKTTYFAPSEKPFMINYRVQNIEKLVAELRASGVTVCDEIETYDYGKFVHILDVEKNKIELWEPVDEDYDKMLEVRMS